MKGFRERFWTPRSIEEQSPQLREMWKNVDAIHGELNDSRRLPLIPKSIHDYDLDAMVSATAFNVREARFSDALWVHAKLRDAAVSLTYFKDQSNLFNEVVYRRDVPGRSTICALGSTAIEDGLVVVEDLHEMKESVDAEVRKRMPGKVTPGIDGMYRLRDTE